jgi:hypothetical protein
MGKVTNDHVGNLGWTIEREKEQSKNKGNN